MGTLVEQPVRVLVVKTRSNFVNLSHLAARHSPVEVLVLVLEVGDRLRIDSAASMEVVQTKSCVVD